jgi:hypothetical protein
VSEPSLPLAPGTSKWVRILLIVAVSCAVGPMVAGSVLWVELTLREVYQGTATPPAEWPAVWGGMMLIGYIVGVPYSLLTSGIYALVAVLAGWRGLMTALVIALIPALLYLTSAASVQPKWYSNLGFWAVGFMMIGIATTTCWYLSRRWHSPST